MLSYALWQRRFAGDPGIVNKTILLDGKPRQVIGVMGEDVNLPQAAELWVPMNFDADPEMKQRKAHFLRPIGQAERRRHPGPGASRHRCDRGRA